MATAQRTDLSIRRGQRRDAADLAVLVDIAAEGMASYMWRKTAGVSELPAAIGRARALRDEGGFSYRNAHIAEIEGEVAGAMVGYPLFDESSDLSDVPPLVRGLVELELAVPDYWYVNVLAVYPEYRGRGIGTALLERADELGSHANTRGMAIIVASGNEDAYRLYQRQGYRLFRKRRAADFPGAQRGQDWLLLTKPHG